MSNYSPVGSIMAEETKSEQTDCASSDSSSPGEEYECKICYNHFDLNRRVPKLLGCSHTFCQECLDAVYTREGCGWRLGCPVCRHRTPVPERQVLNLPDNAAVAATLKLKTQQCPHKSDANSRTAPTAAAGGGAGSSSSGSSRISNACRQFVFVTGCVCAVFSFLSMVVLLFVGLVFVHNFNGTPVGPLCLFAASALALLTLILTWLMCVLQYRHETASTPS